eukprot:jgi/Tetstr1/438570/TSEL_027121.t1
MCGSGSPTEPKMVNAGKVAHVEGVETAATAQARIEVGRREAEDARMSQLIEEQLSKCFATQDAPMPPAATGEEDAIPGGNESRASGMDQNVPDEYYHDACEGRGVYRQLGHQVAEAARCGLRHDGITPAFAQRLEAVENSMEAVDDGHRFRLAYLRKHWDTQMHNGDAFTLDVVQESY